MVAEENLIIIGGGPRPSSVMQKFADLATVDNQGNVLVITWATDSPEEYAEAFLADFSPHFGGTTQVSIARPYSDAAREEFGEQLARASGVFFTGGDQSYVMDVIDADPTNMLFNSLHSAYAAGVVFGGTSAGTAIMSNPMIVGDCEGGVTPLRAGLGLLDPRILVDQHFSQRRRKGRLLAALNQTHLNVGVGIDEGTAIYVRDRRRYFVMGENHVKVYSRRADSSRFDEDIYADGESFEIL